MSSLMGLGVFVHERYLAYMHSTGSRVLQPAAVAGLTTVVGRMMVLAVALRTTAKPSVGANVIMKALQVDGLSFLVRLCRTRPADRQRWTA